jgi:hypothetical protein
LGNDNDIHDIVAVFEKVTTALKDTPDLFQDI